MSNQDKEGSTSDAAASGKFHTVQPLRDLESNWAVDLAKNLEEYLLKICSGEITGEDNGGHLSVNFAEAALLLQGSIQVYSRKVEYLYSLVLHALEFISQKSQQHDQPENSSVQAEENGSVASPAEADDSFWGLDDIPVDAKNSLDIANCSNTPLSYFVKPPANLVVLEGDCLDAGGDSGELESYLLATNDLYRDFILLDTCDAVAVNAFLGADDTVGKGNNGFGRGSSLASKSHKTFFSPSKRSGGTCNKASIGKNQGPDLTQSAGIGHQFENDDCNVVSNVPDNIEHEFHMDDGVSQPGDLDDSDEDDDDDPWKPLNPHERGNLKVKPFRKVKASRKVWANPNKQIPITKEFPLARLHGPISAELDEIWTAQHHVSGRDEDSQAPPYYEILRQSLVLGNHRNCGMFNNPIDDGYTGYDSGPDFEPPDFDMPENDYMNEDHLNPDEHKENVAQFDKNEAFEHEDPNCNVNLEDLCRSHLDSLLASIAETEKQTALAARVSTWKQRIEQNLEEQDKRPPFDIHEYGQRTLNKLSLEVDVGNSLSFADVVKGQEKHDVARTFSALLQLVNDGNVELERVGTGNEFVCYTAANPFHVRLLSNDKRRDVLLRSSKKRAKSPSRKGKENQLPTVGSSSSPLASASATLSQLNCKFSVKLGKVGGIRCSPEGKRRRRSRLVDPVDLNSAG